ncbi:ribonuclease H-like domain-containing protein, partial [Tanacetum coccineum]
FSFFANQSNAPHLDNEDLEQIDADDLKEMDLKWQVAMLTMRVKRAPRNQGNRNRDDPRRNAPVDTYTTNALVVQDGMGGYDWSFQAEEGPTNFALMAYSSSSSGSDSEVHTCSKDCLKSYEALQKQYDQHREALNKSNLEIIGYQMGLESLEARIVVHEKNEVVYEENVAFLNMRKLMWMIVQYMIDSNKVTRVFHAVPPPYTGNYMPPRPDLSFAGLDESVFKSAVRKTTTSVPETETSISKTSKDIIEKPKTVRPSAPIIEEWDTDSDNDSVFRPKSDQTKPKFTKINFVKSGENVKSVNKENTHRQVEYPRKSQSPRGNRRNWNGMMTQKLGNGFEFIKKACFVCGSFNHLIKDCDFHDNKMVEKPVLNNKGRVTGQREIRPVWNNAQRVNHQNKLTHPHPKRNFVPTAVATKSGQVPVNAAKQSSPRAATSISTARPVNTAAPKPKVNDALPTTYSYFKAHSPVRRAFNQKSAAKTNNFNEKVNTARVNNVTTVGPKAVVSAAVGNRENVVKSSACWIWRPTGNVIDHNSKDSGSYMLKRFDYVDLQGRLKHMTGIKSFLTDYQEIDDRFVAFGGRPKGVKYSQLDNETKANCDPDDLDEMGLKVGRWQLMIMYKIGKRYHVVPPPYTGNFMPPKPDLVLADKDEYVFSESVTSVPSAATSEVKTSVSKPKSFSEPLIEDWVSDSENENETKESVKKVENSKQAKYPRKNSQSPRDCDFYEKKMVEKPVWNNARRVNHQNSQRISYPHPKRNFVPRAVLMKFGFKILNTGRQSSSRAAISVNTARPINTAYTRPTVNSARPASNVFYRAHSHVRRPFNKYTTNKNSNFNEKVRTVRENVTTVGPKEVVYDNKGSEANVGNPHLDLQEKGVIDSGCSRNMTGNRSYLSDYEEIDGGFVAFSGNSKGGKITGKGKIRTGKLDFKDVYFVKELKSNLFSVSQMCDKKNSVLFTNTKCVVLSPDFKLTDESHVLLKVPRKDNMYSIDLRNVVPQGGLTCLFAKATLDESNPSMRMSQCNNGTEFKNKEMNQFFEMKGIKREFSVARNPQQNGVAERKNRTLIEAARTMLADSKLPTTFWAEAVNTACYVQNRVLVIKPHNKTPYELFHDRTPSLRFMRPFGCLVTILNTLDHLGKFDGKADEGFFVGYYLNSKAFRVFNSRTRIVEETLHITFLENKPNVVESGSEWLFDIDTLSKSMNYKSVIAGNQTNGDASTKESIDAGPKNTKEYASKKVTKDSENKESEVSSTKEPRVNQEKDANVNIYECEDDLNIPNLEEIVYSDDEDVGAKADMTNLDTHIPVSLIPTSRIHKDHPVEQIIGDIHSTPQTKRMTKR